MKNSLPILVAGLLVSMHSAGAAPFDESKGSRFYVVSKGINKTLPPLARMPVDDYIQALSKSSGFNFIADVTQVPVEQWVQPYPASATSQRWAKSPGGIPFNNLLVDFTGNNNLSDLRYDESTFLLWGRPDAVTTARRLIATGKHRPKLPLPEEISLGEALNVYSQRPLKWIPGAPKNGILPFFTTRLGDLPPELQNQIRALAQHGILRPDTRRDLFLTEDFWKTVRIRVLPAWLLNPDQKQGQKISLLYIGGQDENGNPLPFFPLDGLNVRHLRFPEGAPISSVYARPITGHTIASPLTLVEPKLEMGSVVPLNSTSAPVDTLLQPLPGLTGVQLEADAQLQTKISLEAKRQRLGDVLAEASRKGKVKFSIDAEVPQQNALVTAQVAQMPLGTFMGAIARTYDLSWTKGDGGEFVLNVPARDELRSALLRYGRAGHPFVLDVDWATTPEQDQERQWLEQEIIDALEGHNAENLQGVTFSILPEDLQHRVKEMVRNTTANYLLSDYLKMARIFNDDSLIKISRRTVDVPSENKDPRDIALLEAPAKRNVWELQFPLPAPQGVYGGLLTDDITVNSALIPTDSPNEETPLPVG